MSLTAKAIKGGREKRLEAGAPGVVELWCWMTTVTLRIPALVLEVFGLDVRTLYEPLESVAPLAGVKP